MFAFVVLLACLAGAALFGPNCLRGQVARAAGRALHRSVTIGALALLPAWPPTLRAQDVQVAGLGRAQQVEAQLALGSLLGLQPRLRQLVLRDARFAAPLVLTVSGPGGDASLSLHTRDARGAISAAGRLTGNGQSGYELHDIRAQAPQGDLAGALGLLPGGGHPSLHGTLHAERFDLDAVIAALSARHPPPAAPVAPGAPPPPLPPGPRSPWVIPDRTLPFAALARGDADLTLSAGVLRFGGVDYRNFAAHVVLHQGVLHVSPVSAELPGGGRLDGALQAQATPPGAALTVHAPAVALGALLAAAAGGAPAATGTAALDATLRGRGETLHALASTLDGTATLHLAGGAIDNRALSALLAAARLPLRLPPGQTPLRCLAVAAVAQDGAVRLAPLAADTDRLRVDAAGQVDLARETLALQLAPLLRTGPGLEIPVRLTGPWRDPRVAVGQGGEVPPSMACADTAEPARKHAKPMDLLRSLLR